MPNKQADDSNGADFAQAGPALMSDEVPIYEAEIHIKGKISAALDGGPFHSDNPNEMFVMLEITFEPIREGGEPLRLSYRHPVPVSQLGQFPIPSDSPNAMGAAQSRARLLGQSVKSGLVALLTILANNAIPLVVQWANATRFKIIPSRASQLKDIDRLARNLKKMVGLSDESKPGPKQKDLPLGRIEVAMRAVARAKKSVTLESVAERLSVSVSTLERALRGHKVTLTSLKEKIFAPRSL